MHTPAYLRAEMHAGYPSNESKSRPRASTPPKMKTPTGPTESRIDGKTLLFFAAPKQREKPNTYTQTHVQQQPCHIQTRKNTTLQNARASLDAISVHAHNY